MRYEELSLPLSGGPFHLRFHARLTILAGLTPTQRADIVDALATASAGQVPGGTLVYRDRDGRRVVVRDREATYLDDGSPAPGVTSSDADEVRARLLLLADDLGLPIPLSDSDRSRLQQEHDRTRSAVAAALEMLEQARATQQQRRDHLTELERIEADLAAAGGGAELEQHRYHAALTELERVRTTLDAVNASPRSIAHDEQLLTAAVEAHGLADEWSQAVDRLDELLVLFNGRQSLPTARLEALRDVPERPPANLSATIAEHEHATLRAEQLAAELDQVQRVGADPPSDARVLALATIDPETLWLTHRRVLLANEQLEQARLASAASGSLDPSLLAEVEQAQDLAAAANQRVERQGLTGMLLVSLLVCLSLLLAVADLGRAEAVPALLFGATVAGAIFLLRPRIAARRATGIAQQALRDAGVDTLQELRQRWVDDSPDSPAWRRADEVVDEYEASLEAWYELVGNLSVAEVGELEQEVHRFVAASDPREQVQRVGRVERALERAQSDQATMDQRLSEMLSPYDLDLEDVPHGIGSAIHDRIRDGYTARLQIAMADAQNDERKVSLRLEELLDGLGFRDGNLEARVGALGWAIDEARQRQARRSTTTEPGKLQAERDRLKMIVQGKSERSEPPAAPRTDRDEAVITTLQRRRDVLRGQLSEMTAPDLGAIRLQHDRMALRLAAIANELSDDGIALADDTEERMVATLTNLRPSWFDSSDDPMPAVLDEPFTAVPAQRRGRLLNLVLAAAETTQVVLLTSDPHIALWGRAQAARNTLSLLEPTPETAPATLDA